MMKSAVIIFLKIPARGEVKTRIGQIAGHDFSYEFYNLMVKKIIEEISDTGMDIVYAVSGHEFNDMELFIADNGRSRVIRQRGSSMGSRMYNAFIDVFRYGYTALVLAGSDIPELTASLIEHSVTSLKDHPVCIGPSTDGGYYLIGLRSECFSNEIFSGIDWSTGAVLKQTLERIRASGLEYHLLSELQDMDTIRDVKDYYGRHKSEEKNALVKLIKSRIEDLP